MFSMGFPWFLTTKLIGDATHLITQLWLKVCELVSAPLYSVESVNLVVGGQCLVYFINTIL